MAMVSELRITAARKRADGSLLLEVKSLAVAPKRIMNQRDYASLFEDQIAWAGGLSARRIDILLDSHGGAVHSALGMIHALQGGKIGKIPKRILITGLCGSSATLFTGMGIPIYITPTGRFFIHGPKLAKKDDKPMGIMGRIRERIGTDETVKIMVSCYRGRAKSNGKRLNRAKILDWMRGTGTYFSAKEAEEAGFVDGIMRREVFLDGPAA